MKLVRITVQVQYTGDIERILVDRQLPAWTCQRRVAGRDLDGRHEGSQAFPGSITAFDVRTPDDRVDDLLAALEQFRDARPTHRHLEAYVLPVERTLTPEEED